MKKIFVLLLAVVLCATSMAACGDPREEKYLEAFEMLEQKNYAAAFALFVELGDYKDAAKEAAKFHYAPVQYTTEYTLQGETTAETITFTYNEDQLVSQYTVAYGDEEPRTFYCTYNANGKLTLITHRKAEGTVERYKCIYDENGNALEESYLNDDGEIYFAYAYTYDENGTQTQVILKDDTGNESYAIVYREDGNIAKMVMRDENGNEVKIEEYLYDEKGQNTKINFIKNGVVDGFSEYTYDEKGQMTREHYEYSDVYSFDTVYTYDANGNAVSEHAVFDDGSEDCREKSFKLVYVSFAYPEADWEEYIDTLVEW